MINTKQTAAKIAVCTRVPRKQYDEFFKLCAEYDISCAWALRYFMSRAIKEGRIIDDRGSEINDKRI